MDHTTDLSELVGLLYTLLWLVCISLCWNYTLHRTVQMYTSTICTVEQLDEIHKQVREIREIQYHGWDHIPVPSPLSERSQTEYAE